LLCGRHRSRVRVRDEHGNCYRTWRPLRVKCDFSPASGILVDCVCHDYTCLLGGLSLWEMCAASMPKQLRNGNNAQPQPRPRQLRRPNARPDCVSVCCFF
jgi:hypothetical protein